MALIRHILVPVDGSKHATVALRFALSLAQKTGAQVDVLHVLDTASLREIGRFLGKDPALIRAEARDRAKGILEDAGAVAREAGVKIESQLEEGTPYEAIVDHAAKREADLIVMGRVGTRGPRRLLAGSVAERVMETAPCHLLIIR